MTFHTSHILWFCFWKIFFCTVKLINRSTNKQINEMIFHTSHICMVLLLKNLLMHSQTNKQINEIIFHTSHICIVLLLKNLLMHSQTNKQINEMIFHTSHILWFCFWKIFLCIVKLINISTKWFFSHKSHLYGFASEWIFLCILKLTIH